VKRPAKDCSAQEIFDEVFAQLNDHLAKLGERIDPSEVVTWFLDPDITFPRGEPVPVPNQVPGHDHNQERLFITTVGAWPSRPSATTEIPNLFLASDWLKTAMDFASAEGTNEVARRAVNAILDAAGSKAKRAKVWIPCQPLVFAPLRALDGLLYRLGLPALGCWGTTRFTPALPIR
jgi:hypothetical protein